MCVPPTISNGGERERGGRGRFFFSSQRDRVQSTVHNCISFALSVKRNVKSEDCNLYISPSLSLKEGNSIVVVVTFICMRIAFYS